MSRHKLRTTDYLTHILEAITRVDRYTDSVSKVVFMQNSMA